MTDTNNKIRALFLTALMVFSVFAGTFAFAGTAAAQTAYTAPSSITPSEVDEGTTNSHTVTLVANIDTGDSTHQNYTVDLPDALDTSAISVSNVQANTSTVTVNGTTVDQANGVIDIRLDDTGGSGAEDVEVTYDLADVTAPSVTSDVTAAAQFKVDSGTYADFQTLTVVDNESVSYDRNVSGSGAELVFEGQVVFSDEFSNGETVQLRKADSDGTGSSFITQGTANADGEIAFSTEGRETGNYFLRNETGVDTGNFEIAVQDLTAETDDGEVGNSGDTVETVDISSNRGGSFPVYVSSEDADFDVLSNIVDGTPVDTDDDDSENDAVMVTTSDGGAVDLDFTDVDAGNYNFTFDVADTTAEDTISVNVKDYGTGEADLSKGTTSVVQGDKATFTVELSDGANSGSVLIGDYSEDNYQANVTVEDASSGDDNDGQVTFTFNTYTAGINNTTVTVVELADSDSDDSVSLENQDTIQQNTSDILDTGDYVVSVGADDPAGVEDSPDNVGSLLIEERPAPEQALWRTSEDTLETVEEAKNDDDADATAAIASAIESGAVTQTDTVASSDVLVHQLVAPGLEGMLNADDNNNLAETLWSASQATNYYGNMQLFDITFEETNPGSNAEPTTVALSELSKSEAMSAMTVVYDESSSTYYVAVDVSELPFEDGDKVSSEIVNRNTRLLDIDVEDNPNEDDDVKSQYETAAANFSVEDPEGSFNVNSDDEIEAVAGDTRVTGTTNVAPGTEFSVRVRSTGDTQPRFIESQTVSVTQNGTFTANFNLSDNAEGDTFSATVRQAAFDASADGVLVASQSTATTTGTAGTTTAGTTEQPTTEQPTTEATPTETETEETTSTSTPGFGAVLAVIALIGAALLAVRRDN